MKSLADWLMVIFMGMYWVFRVIVAYMAAKGSSFIATPINMQTEVILLFVTLFCIILVMKRNKIAATIYVLSYLAYFGTEVVNDIIPMIKSNSFDFSIGMNMFFSVIGVVLALVVMIDFLADHVKQPEQKNTDWFYENKEYDRKLDSRADKNNYRTM